MPADAACCGPAACRAGGDQRAAAARQGDRAARSAPAGPASAPGPLAGAPTREQEALSELAFEKAVFEMTALRRELNAWMGAFEKGVPGCGWG